jgi:RNA polymerase sigma factor (sigma-70 family)
MESRNDESATNQVNTRRIGAFPMYDDICRSTNKEAFLRHVVHNLAIDRYRRDRSGLHFEVPIDEVDRHSPLIAPGPTPDPIIDSQQRLDQITALLDTGNPRTREIYLAHQSGYTYAEIADYMGIAKTTIKRAYRSCAYDHHYLGESKPRYSLRETWSMC